VLFFGTAGVYAGHNAQNVIVLRIDADLGGGGSRHGGTGKDQLEDSIINAREVATAAGLMFLRAESKRIDVDTSVGVTSVVLVRLNNVEVGTLTLREAILAVQLQLSSDDGVLAPAVHVEGSLGQDEGAGIRDVRTRGDSSRRVGELVVVGGSPVSGIRTGGSGEDTINSTSHLEEARASDEVTSASSLLGATESMDGVGESIDSIGVVEGLGTEGLEEESTSLQRRAVVNVGIRLDNPDELLARVIEVELDLVAGGADRLVTSELELLNQVLVGVLGELAALIGIKEDIVDVQRGSNKGLLVSSSGGLRTTSGGGQTLDGPQALTDGSDIKVDLDFVILYESHIPLFSKNSCY